MANRGQSNSLLLALNGMPSLSEGGVLVATTSVNNATTATSFKNATATIAAAGGITAGDTVVFTPPATGAGTWGPAVTLTASSTPANENQFEIDGDATADAAALAAAINAHSVLSLFLSATSATSTVTVSAKPGKAPKSVVITETGASMTVVGGAGFGEDDLSGLALVIQSDVAVYLKFGTSAAVTAAATMAGSDLYLDAFQIAELTMHPGYGYLAAIPASGTANVRVDVRL